jgi:disulfide bond formation protein DsbB
LCYYQRTFLMGVAAVLLMALLTESRGSASISIMAMPLAVAGLAVAGWHVYLESVGRLVCPEGLFGLGSGPQQSLAAFVLVFLFLAIGGLRRPASVVALVLGGVLAYGCIMSTAGPKPPDDPRICHPPATPAG